LFFPCSDFPIRAAYPDRKAIHQQVALARRRIWDIHYLRWAGPAPRDGQRFHGPVDLSRWPRG
jgi:hypothetical protein